MTLVTSLLDGVSAVTLETSDRSASGFKSRPSSPGLTGRSKCEDPAESVLELCDLFQQGQGADGLDALASPSG